MVKHPREAILSEEGFILVCTVWGCVVYYGGEGRAAGTSEAAGHVACKIRKQGNECRGSAHSVMSPGTTREWDGAAYIQLGSSLHVKPS